ncbi:MAG: UvrB/UvrC motif-containing protein [Clostridia bacterium]|nr:UvrB/UvrC motif-containing protein [Clostridia bacterium]
MLCEKCKKNNASVFYEENINGKGRSYALCQTCAEELKKSGELPSENLFESFGFSSPITQLHDSLFGSLFSLGEQSMHLNAPKSCSACGSTLRDLQKNGKAGCGECYKTFSSELEPTIRSIHGNARHTGRVPEAYREKHARYNEIKMLRQELKDAISKEDFEKAATLRDKIKELENNK